MTDLYLEKQRLISKMLDEQATEIQSLVRDGRRYRKLRDGDHGIEAVTAAAVLLGDDLDAALDAIGDSDGDDS